jgi:hypothetical protein
MRRLPETFFYDKGKGPDKNIHKIRQPVGVLLTLELPDVHLSLFIFQNGGYPTRSFIKFSPKNKKPKTAEFVPADELPTFVLVNVEVIGCGEKGDERGKARRFVLLVHFVTHILHFMGSYHGEEIVSVQKLTNSRIREEVRAAPGGVVDEEIVVLFVSEIAVRVRPQQITEWSMSGRLPETINLKRNKESPSLQDMGGMGSMGGIQGITGITGNRSNQVVPRLGIEGRCTFPQEPLQHVVK